MRQKQFPLFKDKASPLQEYLLRKKPTSAGDFISSIWSFPGFGGDQIYRWYGTLPRQLLERLFSLYSKKNTTRVLDPFMGLGTTLDIAADNGLPVIGLDSNPLACLASEARLQGKPPNNVLFKKINEVKERISSARLNSKESFGKLYSTILDEEKYIYAKKWFRKDTLLATLELLFQIAEEKEERIQRLMFIAASQTIRAVASVDARCTHHLVTKVKPFIDPVPLWEETLVGCLSAIREAAVDSAKVTIYQGSAVKLQLQRESIDLAILHPPYLGVIHYHQIHRLATDLLDIVSRTKFPASLSKYVFDYERIADDDVSTDNGKSYDVFIQNITTVMQQIIIKDGRCIAIIGDHRYKKHLRHPFTDFISQFEKKNFLLEEIFIWVLQNHGGMHIQRKGNFIDHNYILVFHKVP